MDVIPGRIYEHYKGGRYTVLAVATDSTNARDGGAVVVYVSLTYGVIKCRDLAEFTEPVRWQDGFMKPRFTISS